jgi:2-iminobutanoate/2-iminopropanoate deaminase
MTRRSIHVGGLSHRNPIPMAARIGNVVASSVIAPTDPSTGETPEGLEDQAAMVFANMRRVLEAAGATSDDVVRVGVFMDDPDQRAAVNAAWIEMFPDEHSRPARHTTHESLPAGRLIAADFLAVIDS